MMLGWLSSWRILISRIEVNSIPDFLWLSYVNAHLLEGVGLHVSQVLDEEDLPVAALSDLANLLVLLGVGLPIWNHLSL
jgi:hypothetical protein